MGEIVSNELDGTSTIYLNGDQDTAIDGVPRLGAALPDGSACVLLESGGDLFIIGALSNSIAGAGLAKIQLTDQLVVAGLASSPSFSWYPITIDAKRAMITRFRFTASLSDDWLLRITSDVGGAGELMFQTSAPGDTETFISWPWWFENQEAVQQTRMHVGIRNDGPTSDFTITDLRGERIA
jgi:hypothetical protein